MISIYHDIAAKNIHFLTTPTPVARLNDNSVLELQSTTVAMFYEDVDVNIADGRLFIYRKDPDSPDGVPVANLPMANLNIFTSLI